MIHTILTPLDGSPVAEQALPLALSIGRRAGATLDVVRVHVLYALEDRTCGFLPYDPEEDAMLKREEQAYLDDVALGVGAILPAPATTALLNGQVPDAILGYAKARAADLIVTTTHGRGPLSRAFLGSVADELLRRTPVPLLLVRPQETPTAAGPLPVVQRILIPLDRSSEAEGILPPALELARVLGAAITLLHVVESGRRTTTTPLGQTPSREQRLLELGRGYLERLAGKLRQRYSCDWHTRVVSGGHAASAILDQAETFDLVALATHGRGGVKRLLLGSVADKVIRGTSTPVLVHRSAPTQACPVPK